MTKFVSLASAYIYISFLKHMAKYSNQELINFIIESKDINNEVKSQLIKMLKDNKKYGIVWEHNTEEAYEILREQMPVFFEQEDQAIYGAKASDNSPNHVLIEGDNIHALHTLCYTHEGKFDLIYIDPPYNSGATDWRYNNDYVDTNDSYRHSKWLSMMYQRLLVARKLLNPEKSVLIVTIDEREFHHLGCLLEELFPNALIQMISSVISPQGNPRQNQFNRVDEYIYFVEIGNAKPELLPLSDEWRRNAEDKRTLGLLWQTLMRTGNHSEREHSPNCFYPILVSEDGKRFIGVGEPLGKNGNRKDYIAPDGCVAVWPIHMNGTEGVWNLSGPNVVEIQKKGYIKLGAFTPRGMAISYLPKGQIEKVESGLLHIDGHNEDGSIISNSEVRRIDPGTQWRISTHDATRYGTRLLKEMFGEKVFSFPKSLYAVADTINFYVAKNPNALILDFFAGSGTTLHATMMLNEMDGGKRTCFLVTNNENGICREVTYPRIKKAIEGYITISGKEVNPLPDNKLRYFIVDFAKRPNTFQQRRSLLYASTDLLRVKENCYKEQSFFGSLDLTGKEKLLRYFEESGRKMLIIYEPRVIEHVVNEIKAINLDKDELMVYIFADGPYPYSEEFRDVIDKVNLVAMPYALTQSLKYVLPSSDEIYIDNAELSDKEKEELISAAIESELKEQ